jgi:hypothetical protein
MKTMATHGSATLREEAPHANQPTRTKTILNALTRRAQALLNDKSIDAQSRAIIRYGLEVHDPWLADLVRRAESGERIGNTFDFSQTYEQRDEANDIDATLCEHASSKEEIDGLADMICRRGENSAAAFLVLMGTLENSANPKALARMAKQIAFAHCGELNLFGIVDAQIVAIKRELWVR